MKNLDKLEIFEKNNDDFFELEMEIIYSFIDRLRITNQQYLLFQA